MKILSSKQIRNADKFTIDNEPIAAIDLMERAASRCSKWLQKRFDKKYKFYVFCGTGNNGGDGLAISRLLFESGYSVCCYLVASSKSNSLEFETNNQRLLKLGITRKKITSATNLPMLVKEHFVCDKAYIIIDAIFGSGLNRPIIGWIAELIKQLNQTNKTIVAIDIPSGLYCETKTTTSAIKASYTLAFQLPKIAFLLPENNIFVGDWHLLPIGLNDNFIAKQNTSYEFVTLTDIRPLIKKRTKFSHKGTYGHCLIVAGMLGKMGAAVLCAAASLRSGVGLTTLHIPACGYQIAQISLPEAIVELNTGEYYLKGAVRGEYSAIGIGCGIGLAKETQRFVYTLIKRATKPLVLDADALNILAKHPKWLLELPKDSILTPHPKEFQRLVGVYTDDFDKLAKQIKFAKQYQVYLVLKGAYTSIASPDGKIYFNSTGSHTMAKGGSGDLLTGILVALLAQGYTPKNTCLIGVYLHGLCGELSIAKKAAESVLASDLLSFMSDAWYELKGYN